MRCSEAIRALVLGALSACSSHGEPGAEQEQEQEQEQEPAEEATPLAIAEAPPIELLHAEHDAGATLRVRALGAVSLRRETAEGIGLRTDCEEGLEGCIELSAGAEIHALRCGREPPETWIVETCPTETERPHRQTLPAEP